MAGKSTTATTKLSMQECKRIFRDVAKVALIGSSKIARFTMAVGGVQSQFFTPEATPLSDLDGDPPDFSVGCQWTSRPPVLLHMYIWDQEDRRIVQFFSPRQMGARPGVVQKFIDSIVAADPTCKVQKG